jgi:hypothetical protein
MKEELHNEMLKLSKQDDDSIFMSSPIKGRSSAMRKTEKFSDKRKEEDE